MGNPLACAVAAESLSMLEEGDWQQQVLAIESQLKTQFKPFNSLNNDRDVRVLGAIGVIELTEAVEMESISAAFVEQGIWVRPFGKLVYIMPQYIISEQDLTALTTAIYNVIQKLND